MLASRKARHVRVVGILAALAVVLAGCGSDDDPTGSDTTDAPSGAVTTVDAPGVTDTEIRFASFGTDSNNPLGTCNLQCYNHGIEAFFAYRNADGGVHGRELVLSEVLDDELGKNKQRALEILSADDVFGAFSATQIASGWKDMSEAGIPMFVWSIHPEANLPGIFGYSGATCYDCTSRASAFIAKSAKATKVASLGYGITDSSKLCAQSAAKSIDRYSDELGGAEAVYLNDNLPFGLSNGVGPEVTQMKQAGVDLVMGCLDLNGMKTIAQELERQGMGDVPMFHPNTYDQAFVKAAGDLFEGDIVGVAFRPFEAKAGNSQLDEFKRWIGEIGAKPTEIAMIGWINAATAVKGLELAGETFDRQKVIAALDGLTSWSANGLINPIDYARQHEAPTQEDPTTHGYVEECVAAVRVRNGAFSVIGDPAKPWNCWSNEDRDWSEPTQTDVR